MQPEEGIQAGYIKMYKFHLFFFLAIAVQSGVGICRAPQWRGQSSSHIALRCLPMSVSDSHLVGMLKFNTDQS